MDQPHIPEYRKTEYGSRACPVCVSPTIFISDGLQGLTKCIVCGYSKKNTGKISDGHFYDLPVLLASFLAKRGYYELQEPMDEQIYNKLITAGWSREEAISQVITDLQLEGEARDYFLSKVNRLT